MNRYRTRDIIKRINTYRIEELTPTGRILYQCQSAPPIPWNKSELERRLRITVPFEVEELWNVTSNIRLFEQVGEGVVRLVILGAHQVVDFRQQLPQYRLDELRSGDLVLGHFLEEDYLLIIRCDPAMDDFGIVVGAETLDSRNEWFVVARSISEFLERYLDTHGAWFWMKSDTPRLRT